MNKPTVLLQPQIMHLFQKYFFQFNMFFKYFMY